uniref:Uncharacterized protein n=1 Tax=Arundo donax TaxID=35708 RepID=A0A0A8ZYJ0_ARUDO
MRCRRKSRATPSSRRTMSTAAPAL